MYPLLLNNLLFIYFIYLLEKKHVKPTIQLKMFINKQALTSKTIK